MQSPEVIDGVPVIEAGDANWDKAAEFLQQAVRVGRATPELSYLLALCYKRQGKNEEARAALRAIKEPDGNVLLQMGLLAFDDGDYAEAEKQFAASQKIDSDGYAAAYDQLLCLVFAGKFRSCAEMLPRLIQMAESVREKRFLVILDSLIATADLHGEGPLPVVMHDTEGDVSLSPQAVLRSLTPAEETAILKLLQAVPDFAAAYPLLQRLAEIRPESADVQQACMELVLVRAKGYIDRCQWQQADGILEPLSRMIEASPLAETTVPVPINVTFWNLQGCCACMLQDFNRAVRCFSAAIKWVGDDPWLFQNLAIACELQGRLDQAEIHWNRYFDLLDQRMPTPAIHNYLEELAAAGLNRLAENFSRHERWGSALNFLQRASRMRPRDADILDRLFNLYVQIRRPDDARRTLKRLRELNPNDPQFDLYELDLRDVRTLDDLDRMLADVKSILSRHPGDGRVEERAMTMVANCFPIISRRCDQLTEQLGHIVEQVRRLPNYQINWPVVHDEMHFLRHEFQKMRRISNKCLALVTTEDQRRVFRDLNTHIDSKIDVCISMGG